VLSVQERPLPSAPRFRPIPTVCRRRHRRLRPPLRMCSGRRERAEEDRSAAVRAMETHPSVPDSLADRHSGIHISTPSGKPSLWSFDLAEVGHSGKRKKVQICDYRSRYERQTLESRLMVTAMTSTRTLGSFDRSVSSVTQRQMFRSAAPIQSEWCPVDSNSIPATQRVLNPLVCRAICMEMEAKKNGVP
jgi:hypothetical protein